MEEMQHVLYNPTYIVMALIGVYIIWSNLARKK